MPSGIHNQDACVRQSDGVTKVKNIFTKKKPQSIIN